MPDPRIFFWLALGAFAAGGLYSLARLRSNAPPSPEGGRITFLLALMGTALQTVALYLRGSAIGRCPLTNWFETLMFISWAIALAYLAGGAALRRSALGLFAAPLIVLLNSVGLVFPALDTPAAPREATNPWFELHITLAILSFGAFALAFATGAMYLVQERQLKTHRLGIFFRRLPSIEQLDQINFRFLMAGLALLTVGLLFGFALGRNIVPTDWPMLLWSGLVWLLYAVALVGRATARLAERKVALFSVAAFFFLLLTYWGASLLSETHRF